MAAIMQVLSFVLMLIRKIVQHRLDGLSLNLL